MTINTGGVDGAVGVQAQAARIFAQISPAEAAEHLGIAAYDLEAFEAGRLRLRPALMVSLARLYGISVSDFLTIAVKVCG